MQDLKSTLNRVLREEVHGTRRLVSPPRGQINNGTKPGMSFFAVNDTGDDLEIGDVVEVLTYTASGVNIGYTIRKPSAVNLLNVAVCASRAPVGERVELTTDGTHTVSVSGTVALGATLGTQAGSTALASISIGEAGYPSIGFVAMSASSGGSCQARFFSSSLPCHQPDRAFGMIAKIGVGGGSEDVTVADLYELRDWISANYSLAYQATLYADQTVDTDLILMPYNRYLILEGGHHKIAVESDLNLRTTYARQIDFVVDGTSSIDITTDTFPSTSTIFSNCTFSYDGTSPVRIRIGGALFCTCEFDFDLIETSASYGTRIEILPEFYMLNCDFTFTDRHITDEWRAITKGVQIGKSGSVISNSSISLTDSDDEWAGGRRSLYWNMYGRLVDSDYTIDYPLTSTPTQYFAANVPSNDTISLSFIHPNMDRCTTSVSIAPVIEGSWLYTPSPGFFEREYDVMGQDITITQTHAGISNMVYSPSVAMVLNSPDGRGDSGGCGFFDATVTDSMTGEIQSSTINQTLSVIGSGGNGAAGADGADGTGDGGAGDAGGVGGVATLYDVTIDRVTDLEAIVNSELNVSIVETVDSGVGGNGGAGGNGASVTDPTQFAGNGGDGGEGGSASTEPPRYTHEYNAQTIFNSTISETRAITFSGTGGNGGNGGDAGSSNRENGFYTAPPGGIGGTGGIGYTAGNGGNGGAGSTDSDEGEGGDGGAGGNGRSSFFFDGVFVGGNGGTGGNGGDAGPNANPGIVGGDGGNGGDGGWASEYTNGDTPNTAGNSGAGGTAGAGGTDGTDGSDGEAQGQEGPYPIYVFDENSLAQKYKHTLATNTGYVPDDVWGGSMDANGTIYIDPTTGDDTNDGQSWANAIKTFPLFTRDSETVGYLISDIEYANFTGQQIGVMRPESTVATYRTITGDDSIFTSNPAGEKISVIDCGGDFDGFDGVNACNGTFVNCKDLLNCTGTLATYCDGIELLGDSTTPFGVISYCKDVSNCFASYFYGCSDMNVCDGTGFVNCYKLDLCDSHDTTTGFNNCSLLTNCDSYDNIGWGFYQSRIIDWTTCREYDNGNSCDCPPTTQYPINCPNKEECDA